MIKTKNAPRIAAVCALSLLAGVSGVLKANADGPEIRKFRGSFMSGRWSGFAANSWGSGAEVQATDGSYGPGKPQSVSTAWASGYIDNRWSSGNTYQEFYAGGDGTTTIDAKRNANRIDGTLVSSIPGSTTVWDLNAWSVNSYPITANIQMSAGSDATFEEHVYTVFQTPDGWVRVHRKGTSSVNAQGTGSIQLVDGGGNVQDFVPAGTSTWTAGVNIGSSGEVNKF